jgi:RNA polymerase sigma-70 factor (ECF subfamily)
LTDSGQRRGDPEIVEQLYVTYSGQLRPFLVGLLRDAGLAEEALQQTFQQSLKCGGDVDPQRWKGWLFQVAWNEAMALRRRQKIDLRALQNIARTAPRFGLPVAATLLEAEQLGRLRTAIGQLPPDQREVVRRRIDEERTFQQIADELQVPLGTVLTRMRLALARLRSALQDTDS